MKSRQPYLEFEVIQETKGGYVAACFEERIYVDGQTLEELHYEINSAVDVHFQEQGRPRPSADAIRLVFYKENPESEAVLA